MGGPAQERGVTVYYIERRERMARRPHPASCWCPIYYCADRWPLDLLMRHLDHHKYRITERTGRL